MKIKYDELSIEDKTDYFLAFFLGMDNDIDKVILKYVYKNRNIVSYAQLENYIVYKQDLCSGHRLSMRLKSLIDYKFLRKFDKHNNTFYEIIKETFDHNTEEQL